MKSAEHMTAPSPFSVEPMFSKAAYFKTAVIIHLQGVGFSAISPLWRIIPQPYLSSKAFTVLEYVVLLSSDWASSLNI